MKEMCLLRENPNLEIQLKVNQGKRIRAIANVGAFIAAGLAGQS